MIPTSLFSKYSVELQQENALTRKALLALSFQLSEQ